MFNYFRRDVFKLEVQAFQAKLELKIKLEFRARTQSYSFCLLQPAELIVYNSNLLMN